MTRSHPIRIAVAGSINLDIVARAEHLPTPGETVGGASLGLYPGGKGANQALAARRLGAEVSMAGRVGADANAGPALALLTAGGVDLMRVAVDSDAATGVALIAVDAKGENQIVVAPGANETFTPDRLPDLSGDALILQLEVPVETVVKAACDFDGFAAVNLAPAIPVPDRLLDRADLIIVNEGEAAFYGAVLNRSKAKIAITYGARGAAVFHAGQEVARAAAPSIQPVDTTGAGDTFVGALVVALMQGRGDADALAFACAAGACAALKQGAQTSFPGPDEVAALMN